jgi:hypothetical protein
MSFAFLLWRAEGRIGIQAIGMTIFMSSHRFVINAVNNKIPIEVEAGTQEKRETQN